MTVPNSDISEGLSSSKRASLDIQVVDSLRQGPHSLKELASNLPREQGLVKSTIQGLVKMRLSEEGQQPGKAPGPHKYRNTQPAGGGRAFGSSEPAGLAAVPQPSSTSAYMPSAPLVGYAYPPYSQQMYYYVPWPYGKQPGSSEGLAVPQVPHVMPYPIPTGPYSSSALRPMGVAPGAPQRRPVVSNGWGGMPLGSQALPPAVFPPSPLHVGSLGSSPLRPGSASGPRNTGAARTLPMPPRRASSADVSTAAPPTPQADHVARPPASISSTTSSDGDGHVLAGRAGSVGEGLSPAGSARAGQEQVALEQQSERRGAHAVTIAEDNAASSSSNGCASSSNSGESSGGEESQAAGRSPGMSGGRAQQPKSFGQPGGHNKEAEERQPCAFFLKTGTCAYGDRCKFEHPYELAPHVEFNSLGLPLRHAEPLCSFYMKYKSCGFGHTCKFHHPEITEGDVAVAAAVAPGSPPTPFAAVQYLPFSGGYTMAYTYPGSPIQGQLAPGYMALPPSPAAVLPPSSPSQQLLPAVPQPLPSFAPGPICSTPAAAGTLRRQASNAAEPAAAKSKAAPAALPAKPAAAPSAPIPVPQPLPLPRQHSVEQVESPAAALDSTCALMSPPKPIMVFGRSKPTSE
ncbi:hypothetical protein N2152v2_009798 [Parachlorella kessleri]